MTWCRPRGWSFCLACPRVSWLCGPPAAPWPGSCSRRVKLGCRGSGPSCSGWPRRGTFQFYGPDGRNWTQCAATRSTRVSAWSCPLTPVVSKASAGAMEVMDVFSTDDLTGFLQRLAWRVSSACCCGRAGGAPSRGLCWGPIPSWTKAQQGWLVAGTVGCPRAEDPQSSEIPITSCLEFPWDRPTLLVLGNEGSGLSQEVQASCQLLLTILPRRQLPPGLESLNVSVAAGILLHSICSQWKGFPTEGERRQLLQDPQEPV
ncbi:rRNA methyltransferase 1, mitochondrial isoform X6 [Macaca fascicularis]|uniref:rRNA methyltransferase 1, mitochondrial isoform X6 n=1 Tax=Macaca fascicularis TaxID=9541 RepID=UPI003D15B4A2